MQPATKIKATTNTADALRYLRASTLKVLALIKASSEATKKSVRV